MPLSFSILFIFDGGKVIPKGIRKTVIPQGDTQKNAMATKLIEFHSNWQTDVPGFFTTFLFWDCDCEDLEEQGSYIHPYYELSCLRCEHGRAESPDSRVSEVFRHAGKLDTKLVSSVANAAELDFIPF